MKASAGTATKDRGASASRRAVPRRTTISSPAKAAHAAVAAKKTSPPVKSAKPVAEKTVVKPAAPKPTMALKTSAKAVAHKPQMVAEPVRTPPQQAPAPPPPPAPEKPAAAAPMPGRPMIPDRIPPRPPAKAEIFVEGDHVVYPTHGVGKVERIATEEIAGHKLELIHITFEENRMTLRVPVAKARTAGLRKLATRKLFDEALAVLKGRARIKRTMWSRRAQEYEAKINSGDPLAIAEVVRDLHRNAGQPDQSFSERQIYEAAMDRLAAELAALDKTDKTTAATKLTNFLKTV